MKARLPEAIAQRWGDGVGQVTERVPWLRGRVPAVVLLLAGLLLLLFGLWLMAHSGRLAESVGEIEAQQQLRSSLEARLAAEGSSGLQAYVRALVSRGAMGLRYLSVRVPGGTVVAEASAYDSLDIPMISPLYVERLRATMLSQAGERRRMELQRDGRTLATVDFVLVGGAVEAARVDALAALRAASWLVLALALLLLGSGALLALRPGPAREGGDVASRRPRGAEAGGVASRASATLEGRAAQVLDRLQRGIIIVDGDARIREINRVAEQLTGWSRDEARGRLVYSVFHPLADDDQPLTTPAESAAREHYETPATTCRLRARDGTMHSIEMSAAPLQREGDRVDGAVMFFHDVGSGQGHVDKLRADMQRTQDVVDHLDEGVLTTDSSGVIQFVNARAARMFGYRREQLVGMKVTKLLPVPFLNMPDVRLTDYCDEQRYTRLPRVVGWRQDATSFPVDLLTQPMQHSGEGHLVLVLRDLTAQLRNENLSLRMGRLFDHSAEEIFVFDAQTLYFTEINRAAQKNLGLEDAQLYRMTPAMISEGLDADTLADYCARLRSGQVDHVRYRARHRRADGSSYPVDVCLSYSRAEEPPVFMAIATDISEREAVEARLARKVTVDELTGIANRTAAMQTLRESVLEAVRNNEDLALAYLDLDHFKRINDSQGHDAGDAALREVAQRLHALGREGIYAARLSGDEFIALRSGVADRAEAEAFGHRLQQVFTEPLHIAERPQRVTASIGVAVMRPGAEAPMEPGELITQADRAMYLAKKSGRDRVHVYFGRQPAVELRGQSLP